MGREACGAVGRRALTPRMVGEPQGAGAAAEQVSGLPRAFGRYLLFDRIGRGGMAEIFLARADMALGASRHLVVKQVLAHLSDDEGFARMLIAEAKLAAQLNHQNIVQVVDLGIEERRLFIAMEYVEGFDLNLLLRQLSERRVALPAEFALLIVRETLSAIAYAHRATDATGQPLGVVHRDVSPSNVLISFEGEVKLCDFGIARAFGRSVDDRPSGVPGDAFEGAEESSRIQRARVAGKSAYMAPEHARGDDIDSRADIFAAGILLWELCAGRRLYKGTEHEMLEMARKGDVRPLPDRGLPQHARLQQILDRALKIDPGARYLSAEEMLKDLDAYALATGLMASHLRFGDFLKQNFGDTMIQLRRAREAAAADKLRSDPPRIAALESSETAPSKAKASEPAPTAAVASTPQSTPSMHDAAARDASAPTALYMWIAGAGLAIGGIVAWFLAF